MLASGAPLVQAKRSEACRSHSAPGSIPGVRSNLGPDSSYVSEVSHELLSKEGVTAGCPRRRITRTDSHTNSPPSRVNKISHKILIFIAQFLFVHLCML